MSKPFSAKSLFNRQNMRAYLLGLLSFLWLNTALAFRFPITLYEYKNWPRYCQAADHTAVETSLNITKKPQYTPEEAKIAWAAGIWHYCFARIKVQRAEVAASPQEAVTTAKSAFGDLLYSYGRIPKNWPWAAHIATDIARAHRVVGDEEKAIRYIKEAIELQPTYSRAYAVASLIYFDKADYVKAIEILERGDLATGGKSAELQYFLGLANFNLGDIEAAKAHAKKAHALGYPLTGLARKITHYESQNPAQPSTEISASE